MVEQWYLLDSLLVLVMGVRVASNIINRGYLSIVSGLSLERPYSAFFYYFEASEEANSMSNARNEGHLLTVGFWADLKLVEPLSHS